MDKPAPTADPGAGLRRAATGGTAAGTPRTAQVPAATVLWSAVERPHLLATREDLVSRAISAFDGPLNTVPPPGPAVVREVPRPAPAYHQPAAAVLLERRLLRVARAGRRRLLFW